MSENITIEIIESGTTDTILINEAARGPAGPAGPAFSTQTPRITATTDSPTTSDYFLLVDDDTAAGSVTISLHAVSGNAGLAFKIKKLGTTGNVVIDGSGAETIDGATTATLTTQHEAIEVVCDGIEWHIF